MNKDVILKSKNLVRERELWIKEQVAKIPSGQSILDAGAGTLNNKKFCKHLNYVSQDFCEFDGKAVAGVDTDGEFDTSKVDIVSDIIDIPVDNCELPVRFLTQSKLHV